MTEIWKPISGFENLYKVSDHGNVFSIRSNKVLSPDKGKYGHRSVQLYGASGKTRALVHRLVAFAFLGDPPVGHEVNHIDYDPTNNHVRNLEWVTHRQNILHSRHRLVNKRGEDHIQSKLTEADIKAIRQRYAEGGISFVKLGALYGICGQQCHRIVRCQRWSHI